VQTAVRKRFKLGGSDAAAIRHLAEPDLVHARSGFRVGGCRALTALP